MKGLVIVNIIIVAFFLFFYGFQLLCIPIAYLKKGKPLPPAKKSKLAVLICARNEEMVISRLIESLKCQDYPKDDYTIFVAADNCTDSTAEKARESGALVYERFDDDRRGKGYALDYLISKIWDEYGKDAYDAFVLFDADNVAEGNYLTEINKVFSGGYDVITSYRNSSNYGKNWLTRGSGMYFLRDAAILNRARAKIHSNTVVTGTGFLISNDLVKSYGGWPFHTLTEDGEFTMENVCKNVNTSYAHDAVFYDDQPETLRDSWNQRVRWCKGGLQIIKLYTLRLIKGIFSKRCISFYDMATFFGGAYLVAVVGVLFNIFAVPVALISGADPMHVVLLFLAIASLIYFGLLSFSLAVTVSEWKRIKATPLQKILSILTFPFFIFSFAPPAFAAIFKKKVEWKSIRRNIN